MEPQYTGMHQFSFSLSDDGILGTPREYLVTIVIGLYDVKRVKKQRIYYTYSYEPPPPKLDNFAEVPSPVPTSSWWDRRTVDERQAELRIEPMTSDGLMHISFTKPVKLPEDVH